MVLNSRSSTTRVSFFIGWDRPPSLSFQATRGCGRNKAIAVNENHLAGAGSLLRRPNKRIA
jgi:hypothetical protein